MMRRHGWQLPYHTLQVVAVAVFLTLGFAFYVLFAPFLGKMLYHYVVMGIYTPLIICVFGLYVWCAAVDPADPGVFRSKKYLKVPPNKNNSKPSTQKLSGEPDPVQDANVSITREETNDNNKSESLPTADGNTVLEKLNLSSHKKLSFLALLPCAFVFNSREQSSVQHMSEDGMFYCSLCEVEVFKYSKHCRVCDKCVDHFDHHCRCLNNCIGKRNYRIFFTLLMSALLLFILQWSTGILVLICCFLEREKFSTDISTKLGSSFSVVPFVIVVAVCTILAMIATLPIAQLFFFHILLIKKGLITYDYIIALREQEQEASEGQHSPQMSTVSSITGFSSTSSFNNFHRAAWCTPPRRFLEDRFDVVPPDTRSVSSLGKKIMVEEPSKKKNPAAVKISPWTLARLNAEDVSKAAAEARKKSKTLRRVMRNGASNAIETDSSFGSSGRIAPRLDSNRKTGGSERIRLPAEMPLQPLSKISSEEAKSSRNLISETSTSLTILQHEARSAFRTGQAMPDLTKIVASSPDSSSDSPYIHPFQGASSASQKERQIISISGDLIMDNQNEIPFSRSTSGGYDASGGEDSDQISTRIIHGSKRVATSYIAKP
ncbi:probable protein S-acyltransferase 22 isoform X2 [Primulina huaijiensis]|uniref:probable protein S-acyltransferase 22 isoform X2 n=1 Tax=Primulina huaijiensis TaxID=1492673 RepID=UPI003CC71858